jgi:uncharacterized phiE125 gp8 family phage protein
MSLQLNTPPATEPVTLAQAKAWLRVESGHDEDALIAALIPAARARAEWHTGRAFITQGWTLWLDASPGCIEVPLAPLQSVESVTLHGADGTAAVLDEDVYAASGQYLMLEVPPLNLRARDGIAVAFTAGYGDADDVPAAIAQAILQILASLYEHRGGEPAPTPDAALALLAPFRSLKL